MEYPQIGHGTGLSIPLSFATGISWVFAQIVNMRVPTLSTAMNVMVLLTGVLTFCYTIWKWNRDRIKAKREDEEYQEEHKDDEKID